MSSKCANCIYKAVALDEQPCCECLSTLGQPNFTSVAREGTKHDAGKPPMSLIPTAALVEEAKVLAFGAAKYSAHNWRLGISYSRLVDAALRHLTEWKEGDRIDAETSLSHLAHARCCLGFLLHYESKQGLYQDFDDLWNGYQELLKSRITPTD